MKCKVCGSTNIVYDAERGEYYCADCGYVIKDFVEIQYTVPRYRKKTVSKEEYIREKRAKFELERKRRRTYVKYDKQEIFFREIERIFSRFNVSDIEKEEAKKLLKKALKDNELRQYSSYVALLIAKYILNKKGIMISIEQIADMGDVPKSRRKLLRKVWRWMYVKKVFKKRITVADYLYYAFNKLNIPLEMMDDAYRIWAEIDGRYNGYSSRVSPRVFAGLLVAMLNKKYELGISLNKIAKELGVTPLIIRIHLKNVSEVLSDGEV